MPTICITRLLSFQFKRSILGSKPCFTLVQSVNLTSVENRDPSYKRAEPWPYKTKKFTYWHQYICSTSNRFDENTKLIVVEGNVASGKGEVAKQLAKAFDFIHFPTPNLNGYFETNYGHDLRPLNPIVPEVYKSYEIHDFYKDPKSWKSALFQYRMFTLKYSQYIDALVHIVSTGQGVVMERSAFSDFVFFDAMNKFGCFRKEVRDLYYDIQGNTLDELLKPHLIVYLDVKPEVCLQRIKELNRPGEKDSPILNMEYLTDIENLYKQKYLKNFEKHSEILVYDWNNYGDVEVVVEDIEKIDFDKYGTYDTQMKDWRKGDDWEWGMLRRDYCNHKMRLLSYAYIFRPSVWEVFASSGDALYYKELLEKLPGVKYAHEFNPDAGDSVLFKTKRKNWKHRWFAHTHMHF